MRERGEEEEPVNANTANATFSREAPWVNTS